MTPKLHPDTSSCNHLYPCLDQEHTNLARVKEKEEEEEPGSKKMPQKIPQGMFI
jgi:hypothetical protein